MSESRNITARQLRMSLERVKENLDKKAEREHGKHVAYSATVTTLVPGGEGSVGSYNNVARGDHVHAIPAYPTELKSPGDLRIIFSHADEVTYDGAQDVSIDLSHSSIGAAPNNHANASGEHGLSTSELYGHAKASTTTPLMASSEASVGTETASFARGDHVHPEQTDISGGAGYAYRLANPTTFRIGSTSKSYDGTSGVSWDLSEIGAASADAIEQATDAEVDTMMEEVFTSLIEDPSLNSTSANNADIQHIVDTVFGISEPGVSPDGIDVLTEGDLATDGQILAAIRDLFGNYNSGGIPDGTLPEGGTGGGNINVNLDYATKGEIDNVIGSILGDDYV